ncbi:GTP cyclohydrolase II [Streptomyces luteolus]|uniref:hypothetical protein n=1 Tax=Streptomyces luteolus TaxID=3043615 RepID=UPI0032B754F8
MAKANGSPAGALESDRAEPVAPAPPVYPLGKEEGPAMIRKPFAVACATRSDHGLWHPIRTRPDWAPVSGPVSPASNSQTRTKKDFMRSATEPSSMTQSPCQRATTASPSHPADISLRTRVRIPLEAGAGQIVDAQVLTFDGLADGREHLAIRLGAKNAAAPLVRLHSECLTGDAFGSARCDCGPQLHEAIRLIDESGGVPHRPETHRPHPRRRRSPPLGLQQARLRTLTHARGYQRIPS